MSPGHVVVEDAPHHRRLGLIGLQTGRPVGRPGHAAVAVRGLPGDDLPGPGPPQLAPAVALGDLRPLILADDPLNLGEQPSLGVIERRGVDEAHPDPQALELVEHHDLVGVGTRQAVGRQAPHRLNEPGLCRIAQRVEGRSIKAGARIAVVAELAAELVALCGDAGPQGLQLRTDGPSGFLGLGGHPGVDRRFHPKASSFESSTSSIVSTRR